MRWRNIKKAPKASSSDSKTSKIRYAGFWSRALGFVTDIFMIGLPVSLVIMVFFGYDQMKTAGGMDVIVQSENAQLNPPDPVASLTQLLLFMSAYVIMWRINGQTPGKKFAQTKVVDAKSFERASWLQLIVRFAGYFLSFITLIGFFVGLLRKDKRTLHDLISRTAVIYE